VIVRVALAAVVSLALLAAAVPAVEHATRTRDAATVDASADRVVDAVTALYRRNDPVASIASAPRRTLELDLPEGTTFELRTDPPRLVTSPAPAPNTGTRFRSGSRCVATIRNFAVPPRSRTSAARRAPWWWRREGLSEEAEPTRPMRALFERFGSAEESACGCAVDHEDGVLRVDATDCDGGGALTEEPACRATAATAARRFDPRRIVVDAAGFQRAYDERAAALFTAAGRFAARVADREERLATRATTDPLAAAAEASGRAGPVADVAAETGFAAVAGTSRRTTRFGPEWGPRSPTLASN